MSNSLGVLTLDLIANLGGYIEPLNRADRQTRQSTNNINQSLGNVDRQVNQTNAGLKVLSTTAMSLGGCFSINAIKNYADSFTNLHNRLKLVTQVQDDALKSQVNLQLALSDTFRIAQAAAADWGGTSAIYEKIYKNSELLKLSQQEVGQVAETVSKAISNSSSSAQAASAALYQLGQSFDKGNLNGDEFVSISENAGYLMDVFAKGLGVTRAELRAMSSEGVLTAEVMTKALRTMYEEVNSDYANTQTSLAGGWNLISNAIQNYVGRSDQALGVTSTIVSSMTVLSENIDLTVDVLTVLGAYLGGVYVANLVKSTASMVQQTLATVASTGAARQKILSDYEVARSNLAATAAMVRAMGVANAQTAAMVANARAAYQQASAQKAVMLSSTGLLGVLGGPVGIGLTVASLAAGYLLMSNGADKANAKLAEQAQVAQKTREELVKLQGVERKSAIDDMTAALDAQNKELRKSELAVGSALIKIQNYGQYNAELTEISNAARLGTMSYTEALESLNQMDISSDLYNVLKKEVEQYDKNSVAAQKTAESLAIFGEKTVVVGNQSQNAAVQHKKQADEIAGVGTSATSAASALTDYQKKLDDQTYAANYVADLMAKGFDRQKAEMMLQAQLEAGRDKSIDAYMPKINEAYNAESKRDAAIKSQNESLKQQNKILDQQNKNRLVGLVGSTGLSTGNHLDIRYARAYSDKAVSAEHLARFQLGGKTLKASDANDGYRMRGKHPVTGKPSFHRGYDFRAPAGTEVTTNYAVTDVKTWFDKNGGGYTSTVTFSDGVKINLLHQIPAMQSKVKAGSSAGNMSDASKDIYDAYLDEQKELEKQLQARRQIELDVADEVTKIRAKLADDLDAIDKAGFDNAAANELRAKYQERADTEIQVFRDQQQQKLDELVVYRKSEKELLLASRDEQIKAIDRDKQLNTDQKIQAVFNIRERTDFEISMIELASEKRIFEASRALMSETEQLKKRYQFERDEIMKNTQIAIDEKDRLIAISIAQEAQEKTDRYIRTSGDWADEAAQMNGTSEYYRLGQNRASQESKSEELMLAETASANTFEEEEAAWQAHAQRMLAIEQDYQDKKASLNLSYGEQIFGSTTDILARTLGEQHGFYKASFTLQKMASIASSIVAIKTGIAQAAANPFPMNLGAMVSVTSATANIVSDIDSVAGVFHGGASYVPKEASYLLDEGERVLSPKQNTDFTAFMAKQNHANQNGSKITINNNSTAKVIAHEDKGQTYVTIDEVDQFVSNSLARPNSRISKSFGQHTTATRRR